MAVKVVKKILVSGSSGFLGGSFKKHFSHLGFDVKAVSRDDIVERSFNPEVTADAFIHFAARVHQKEKQPFALYFRDNFILVEHALEYARRCGCKHFIFISTVAVYGVPKSDKIYTVETPEEPTSPYGISKLMAEKLAILNSLGMRLDVLRIPLVLDSQAPGNIASLVKLIHLLPVLPFGRFNEIRSYLTLDGLFQQMEQMLNLESQAVGEIRIHLLSDRRMSTRQVIQFLASQIRSEAKFLDVPLVFFKVAAFLGDLASFMLKKSFGLNSDVISKLNDRFIIEAGTRTYRAIPLAQWDIDSSIEIDDK